MRTTNSTQKLAIFGRFALRLVVVAVVTFAAANIASFAAFPEPEQDTKPSSDAAFWSEVAENNVLETQKQTGPEAEPLPEPSYAPPAVGAAGYIVADVETGHIFASKQSGTPRPIASISKLMTAVIAQETLANSESIVISPAAVATYGFAGGLQAGESFTLETMYYPLLLESSNDAATAIADAGETRSTFVNLMNRKAIALGMGSTRFGDPSGLSQENISTPKDLLALTRYIANRKEFIFDITTRQQATGPSTYGDGLRNWTNNNPMVGLDDYVGGKNGYTDEARHTLLSLFDIDIADETRTVAIIVLGSETHVEDVANLLAWSRAAL